MAVDQISGQKTIEQIIQDTANKSDKRNTGELGKSDFLNLLVTQLRYQDPLNPVEDKEFIAQMAQFTSLEQMQNMNSTLTQAQGFSLIGKTVTATVTDETTKAISTVEGSVTGVKMISGKVYVVVNERDVPIENISNVTDAANTLKPDLSQYVGLIGSKVTGFVYDSSTGSLVPVSGMVKSLKMGAYEDYFVMDGVEVDVSRIVTDTPSADPDFNKNYLNANKGKEVTLEVVDRSSNAKVKVKGILKDYSIGDDGKIKAVLDKVNVPVESMTDVSGTRRPSISTYTSLIDHQIKGSIYNGNMTNSVSISGIVKSVKSGLYEDYAIVDGIRAEIVELNGQSSSSDQNAIIDYLNQHQGESGEIDVIIRDSVSGQRVAVKGTLASYENVDGKLIAVINQVNLPVNDITDVLPKS
ncbi:flagellar hook capping protein [Anaerobacterium chartisolvens]|uniref:Basal-body rod modification protein FlgD n=1 Tax=Anaerobacterium chartisolvens TaxID=1297424 RepID=A0A369B4N2_9FIRM|nr:flagellar hook capping FlgD N-terminal domain-containing protein [Anaerobacterium chartisolvens]RCX15517.1 flagellar hook capping protein [Anaerobacterium chartisolvens]